MLMLMIMSRALPEGLRAAAMFLASAAALLPARDGANVLAMFSLQTQRTLCHTVVRDMHDRGGVGPRTEGQASWLMEIVGNAYNLPFDTPEDVACVRGPWA